MEPMSLAELIQNPPPPIQVQLSNRLDSRNWIGIPLVSGVVYPDLKKFLPMDVVWARQPLSKWRPGIIVSKGVTNVSKEVQVENRAFTIKPNEEEVLKSTVNDYVVLFCFVPDAKDIVYRVMHASRIFLYTEGLKRQDVQCDLRESPSLTEECAQAFNYIAFFRVDVLKVDEIEQIENVTNPDEPLEESEPLEQS